MRLVPMLLLIGGCCFPGGGSNQAGSGGGPIDRLTDRAKEAVVDKVAEEVTEKAVELATGAEGVEIDKDGGAISFITKDGAFDLQADEEGLRLVGQDGKGAWKVLGGDQATWPEGLPVARYPGAEISFALDAAAAGDIGKAVTMTTPDAPADVIAFYESELGKLGTVERATTEQQPVTADVLTTAHGGEKVEVYVGTEKTSTMIVVVTRAQAAEAP